MRAPLRIALALAVWGLVLAPAGAEAAKGRPDLVVSKGTVAVNHTRLAGSFVVRNAGRVRSRRSSAALTVKRSGETRVVKRFTVPALERGESRRLKVAIRVASGLPVGRLALRACADARGRVGERSEDNNCRRVGTLVIGGVDYEPETVFALAGSASSYWIYVPASYDPTHATPAALLVWLHGCGGQAAGDIYTVAPGADQRYIAIALGGREGGCWRVNADTAKVLAAVDDVRTRFNIDPRRVILGGYSSGGDLAYRTAFYNAERFAGVLAENTAPFRDTGSTQTASIAAAAWRFHVVHLAHTEDHTYPIATVRAETDALAAAGFPVTRIERPGSHYDADTATTGTDLDLRTLLLPHMGDGWLAPR